MDEQTQVEAPAETARVFDATREVTGRILSGGEKRYHVRFPSDVEWCKRSKDQRTIRQNIGRGKSTTETVNADRVDLELFQKIRMDADGPEFDEAEAASVIAKLESARIVSSDRTGDSFTIELDVPKAETSHVLRIPKQSEIREYQRAAIHVIDDRRSQDIRISLEPSGVLYDKVVVATTGYVGAVPIVHKSAVVSELLYRLKLEEEDSPED